CRNAGDLVCWALRDSLPSWPDVSTGHRLDPARLDELDKCRLADANMAADLHELGPALGDQPPPEPSPGTQGFCCCFHGEQPRRRSGNWQRCHATLLVAGGSALRSWARRLASSSVCFHRIRSATTRASRLGGGR